MYITLVDLLNGAGAEDYICQRGPDSLGDIYFKSANIWNITGFSIT